MNIHLSTDGSINGKKGGWAFVLRCGDTVVEDSGAEWTKRGINYFELIAILKGLERLKIPTNVIIYTDSFHVIFHGEKPDTWWLYQKSKLWKEFLKYRKFHNISFIKVGTNRFHEDQRRAHYAAKEAAYALNSEIRDKGFSPVTVGS